MNNPYDLNNTPADLRIGRKADKPMPSRKELLRRDSFPGPDNNKHLDRMLGIKHVPKPDLDGATASNKLAEKKAAALRCEK